MKKRGRPTLGLETVSIRLYRGQPERIDAALGENQRSEFIRELVEQELQKLEKAEADQPKDD